MIYLKRLLYILSIVILSPLITIIFLMTFVLTHIFYIVGYVIWGNNYDPIGFMGEMALKLEVFCNKIEKKIEA